MPRWGVLVRVDEREYLGEGRALRDDGPQVPEPEESDHKPHWAPVNSDAERIHHFELSVTPAANELPPCTKRRLKS